MTKVTLQTIATETGLSKFAVSRALSGKDGVSDKTRILVTEAAQKLGYRKPLPSAAPKPLGVVFDDTDIVNSELHMQIQSGVQREAQRMGYAVRILWTHHPEELEQLAQDSAGLLIVGPHDEESLQRAYATGVPIARNGWLRPLEQVDQVGGTDREAGAAVADYLTTLGHRRIAYVHGEVRYRGRLERLSGFREVMDTIEDSEIYDMIWHEEEQTFADLLTRLHDSGARPTAYFCAHDGLAVTVVSELLTRGYRVPEDASVVGFGDFSAAQQIRPPLTTVKTHGVEVGMATVRLLHERLQNGAPQFPRRVHVPSRIIERGSTGPANT